MHDPLPQRQNPRRGLTQALHLPHRPHRIDQMIQQLMAKHHVEAAVRIPQPLLPQDIHNLEAHISHTPLLGSGARRLDHTDRQIYARDVAVRYQRGDIAGDGAGAAADVEDGHGGVEVREEEGGVFSCRAAGVGGRCAGGMADGVVGVGS